MSYSKKTDTLRTLHMLVPLALLLTMAACGSTGGSIPIIQTRPDYNQLPVETIRLVATEFEGYVAQEIREPELEDRENLIIDTPEVRQALRSRAARYTLVQDMLDSGHMMEQRNGKISILRSGAYKDATDRRERDRHALIVISENRDRVTIYESLQQANVLTSGSREAIAEIFARERFDRLEPGQKYQDESGDPTIK